MFDEYYVVLCGTYRSTSTNECDHNNKYTDFIIARSFARPPSLLLLLCPMVIGMTLCFEVMNTVVVVQVWREYSYTCTYRSTSTKNEGDHDNKCMHSMTNNTTDIYLVRVHLMSSVSRPKNERFIDWQSRGSWGALFTWFQSVTVFEKKVTGYTRFWLLPFNQTWMDGMFSLMSPRQSVVAFRGLWIIDKTTTERSDKNLEPQWVATATTAALTDILPYDHTIAYPDCGASKQQMAVASPYLPPQLDKPSASTKKKRNYRKHRRYFSRRRWLLHRDIL